MTSARARTANRQNAQASTGPRTAFGKARASQNARKHGLAASATDPDAAARIEHLAAQLVAERGDDPALKDAARALAEAHGFLCRVLTYKRALMREVDLSLRAPGDSAQAPGSAISDVLHALEALQRYERRAFSRRNSAMSRFEALSRRPYGSDGK